MLKSKALALHLSSRADAPWKSSPNCGDALDVAACAAGLGKFSRTRLLAHLRLEIHHSINVGCYAYYFRFGHTPLQFRHGKPVSCKPPRRWSYGRNAQLSPDTLPVMLVEGFSNSSQYLRYCRNAHLRNLPSSLGLLWGRLQASMWPLLWPSASSASRSQLYRSPPPHGAKLRGFIPLDISTPLSEQFSRVLDMHETYGLSESQCNADEKPSMALSAPSS